MDLTEGSDFFESLHNAFENDSTIDDNNQDGLVDDTIENSQYTTMMPSNTISSSSLHDHNQQQHASYPEALQLQNIASDQQVLQLPSTAPAPTASASSNTVPEFLYQLTKMLTHDNSEIIEWSNGK